jgi:hypothetical protein
MRLALFSHEKPKRVTTWKMPSFSLAAPAQMLGSIKKFITSKMPPSHLAALEHALERSKRRVEWDLIMDVLYLLWLGVVSYLTKVFNRTVLYLAAVFHGCRMLVRNIFRFGRKEDES